MHGELRRSRKLKVGYFAQHQTDELDLDATPLLIHGARWRRMLNAREAAAPISARFGFEQDKALAPRSASCRAARRRGCCSR